jgi:formylmethanofuran dehydrogenase subunit E/inosine-uridine nucleoside N-ribohydrolase
MKLRWVTLILITLSANVFASPLHLKLKHTIIIDTDCSIHDLRAVGILLSHPGITIKAMIISDGQVKAEEGYKRMTNLLHELKADSIPILCREQMYLENKENTKDKKKRTLKDFKILPQELFLPADTQITIVCLGPLSSITGEIENNPALRERVEEVIWYIDSVNPLNGFNYVSDKASADRLLNSGFRVDAISGLKKLTPVIDSALMSLCEKSGTNISKSIIYTASMIMTPEEKEADLSMLSEEVVALFLGNHELFELSSLGPNVKIRYNTEYSSIALRNVIRDMITGNYRSGHFIALYGFPVDPELYVYDVRQILKPALEKYGIEEWKACTLTDEFHGHLGVFSIVGAKMGILARDHFGIATDLLEVSSYAGSTEPFSCMNDGIQISTGATLGQGSIHLINDTLAKPQAVFTYQNSSVLIRLKSAYLIELKSVLDKGVRDYGLQDEGYWNLVRQTALKFWLEWNRNEIFELTIL